jgi:endogenous inhibitor of DNA gyrase (YacG/DUF329 family)
MADLGRWFAGDYRVAGPDVASETAETDDEPRTDRD